MTATTINAFNGNSAPNPSGGATSVFMGRTAQNVMSGIKAIGEYARGHIEPGLKLGLEAGKVALKTLKTIARLPFASREMEADDLKKGHVTNKVAIKPPKPGGLA